MKAQNKTNDAVLANAFRHDELDRFSKSDYRWADNRSKPFRHRPVKKGEIYQFEFGKNFQPEMPYEHRGLVIGVKQKLLYVLPIFSYNPDKHPDVYHLVEIEELVIWKYFPNFMYEYAQMAQKLSDSETALSEKEESLKSIESENEELKRQITELTQILSNSDNQ